MILETNYQKLKRRKKFHLVLIYIVDHHLMVLLDLMNLLNAKKTSQKITNKIPDIINDVL